MPKFYEVVADKIRAKRAMTAPGNWGANSPALNESLAKFMRTSYGYSPELRNSYLNNLRRQAGIASAEYANRAGATLPGRSAAVLDRFRQAGRMGADIYTQGALPFTLGEQGLREQQRQADIGFGLGLFRTQEERDRFLRQLMMQKYAIDKSREFSFGDFMGNLLGAGAQVASAGLL